MSASREAYLAKLYLDRSPRALRNRRETAAGGAGRSRQARRVAARLAGCAGLRRVRAWIRAFAVAALGKTP